MNCKVFGMRLMVVAFAFVMFASCSSEDGGMTEQAAREALVKANISDAEYLYVRSAATRAETDGSDSNGVDMSGGWKVDKYGNETRIKVYDKNNNEVPIEITGIYKRTDNMVMMDIAVGPKDKDRVWVRILVDKTTNKIYTFPEEMGGDGNYVEEYPKGVLYYAHHNLYKATVTPEAIVEESILPDGEYAMHFLISKGGVVYYVNHPDSPYYGGGTILMPSKRLYPVKDEYVFISGDRDLFSLKQVDDKWDVYCWQIVSNNEMQPVKVGTLPCQQPVKSFPINKLSGSAIVMCMSDNGEQVIYEVDNKSVTLKRAFTTPAEHNLFYELIGAFESRDNNGWSVRAVGKTNYFVRGNNKVIHFDAQTYDVTERDLSSFESQYKLNHIEVDSTTGKIIFKGLRYQDGVNVLGEIDANGVVTIISEQNSQYQITTYCALN